MKLELNNTKTLIDNPNLEEHIIKYASSTFSNKRFSNVEFKGFIEYPYNDDVCNGYYGFRSIDDTKIYAPIEFFEYNKEIENETFEILNFIDHKKREYNRTSKQNNIYYSDEEIKELFLPFIDLNNMEKYFNDYKYVLFIEGCDDGSKFIRFNSEEKRNLFLDKAINFENFDDIFTYEEEEYFLFDWN